MKEYRNENVKLIHLYFSRFHNKYSNQLFHSHTIFYAYECSNVIFCLCLNICLEY